MLTTVLLIISIGYVHSRRIVNGIETTTSDWPWIVSIRFEGKRNPSGTDFDDHFCGGTVIRRTKPAAILTAAHCIEWLDHLETEFQIDWNIWLDLGRDDVSDDTDESQYEYQSYKMNKYIYHSNVSYDSYYENTAIYDIGIIFIDDELPSTQPVVTLNNETNILQDGDELILIGYGLDNWPSHNNEFTDTLEQTNVFFINDYDCNLGIDDYFTQYWPVKNYTLFLEALGIQYGNMDQYPYNVLQCEDCIICAIGNDTDACYGDSGSPLIMGTNDDDAIQVGIVSYGFECNIDGIPAQYADVAYFYEWIQNALNLNEIDVDDSGFSMQFTVSCLIAFFAVNFIV